MPPTRWLSISASLLSFKSSQANSTALSNCSAWSKNSRSVITICTMGMKQMILVRAQALSACVATLVCVSTLISGCGQKGPLYMSTDPDFKDRATLPELIVRKLPGVPSDRKITPPPVPGLITPLPVTQPDTAVESNTALFPAITTPVASPISAPTK